MNLQERSENVRIADLHLDPANVRKHGPDNLGAIAASLKRFGQQKPIVVSADGIVIAGNGTLEAARSLGWEAIAVVRSELSGPEAMAYAIADNRTAELADWDDPALVAQLESLKALDPGLLAATGYDEEALAKLAADLEKPVSDDEVPEPPANPVTRPGDLIVLGRHRLLCGDSTDPATVSRLLDGATPEIMVTDPPYGVEYDPTWRVEAGVSHATRKMGAVLNDDRADWSAAWKLFPGSVAYVWHAGAKAAIVQASLESAGFGIRAQIIWAKDRMALSRGDYHWQHEPCLYAVQHGASDHSCPAGPLEYDTGHEPLWYAVRREERGRRNSDRGQTTLWEIPAREDSGHGHGTQKPVECMARPLRNHWCQGVYDPFCGSGTTLIAAEQLGNTCYAMELDPGYCDVIVRRWEQLTGEQAERPE